MRWSGMIWNIHDIKGYLSIKCTEMTFCNGLSQTRLESSVTETIMESHLSYFNLILNYKKTRNLQKKVW